jgi:hypothetical protein
MNIEKLTEKAQFELIKSVVQVLIDNYETLKVQDCETDDYRLESLANVFNCKMWDFPSVLLGIAEYTIDEFKTSYDLPLTTQKLVDVLDEQSEYDSWGTEGWEHYFGVK